MPTLPAFTKPLFKLSDSLHWLGPLALRLIVGAAFVVTGWAKLHNLDKVTQFFESLHIPAASLQAPMVATIEFAGGLLVVLGLGTRVAAALLVGVMGVALLTSTIPAAEDLSGIITSIEAAYLVAFVYLALNGAGAASLDRVLWRRPE